MGFKDIGVKVACKQDSQSMAGAISLRKDTKLLEGKHNKRNRTERERRGRGSLEEGLKKTRVTAKQK